MSKVFTWYWETSQDRLDCHIDNINVGFAIVIPREHHNWLENLEVHNAYRRQGIAKALLIRVIKKYQYPMLKTLCRPHGISIPIQYLYEFYRDVGGFIMTKDQSDIHQGIYLSRCNDYMYE